MPRSNPKLPGSEFQAGSLSRVAQSLLSGRFELLKRVGTGGFGTVYKARDPHLDRIVAVKILRAGNLASPEDCDRFLREARSAAQLRHPFIVSMFEVGQADGLPFLVFEFIEGLSLADWLSRERMAPRAAAALLADVADALQYAHAQGVVHRDVKPSNVMIRPDGSPCVMDFGLAKREAGEVTMTVLACPITSEISERLLLRPIIEVTESNGLRVRSQVMTDRLLAVPRDRVRQIIGTLDSVNANRLDAALLLVLGLAR